MCADEIMRSEHWHTMKEEGPRSALGADARFKTHPWDLIMEKSAFGAAHMECSHWWFMRTTARVDNAKTSTALVDAIEGLSTGSQASIVSQAPFDYENFGHQGRGAGTGKVKTEKPVKERPWHDKAYHPKGEVKGKGKDKSGKGKDKSGKGGKGKGAKATWKQNVTK